MLDEDFSNNSHILQYGRDTLRHIFIVLPRTSLMETSPKAPPYSNMGETLFGMSSPSHNLHNGCQASSIRYLHVDHLEVAPHNLDVDHHMTPTSMSIP